jgi:hypothetical protein
MRHPEVERKYNELLPQHAAAPSAHDT